MDGDRISKAIARIEAATKRIDAASGSLGASDQAENGLSTKHDALKKEVSEALSDLDKLIEGLGQ